MEERRRRCVIAANAEIKSYSIIKRELRADDFIIAADGGLKHLEWLNIKPDICIGDFDSCERPTAYSECRIITLKREKDDTDSRAAAELALSMGFKDILLIGVFGGRLDHTIGNISLMLYLKKQGCNVNALDDYSIFTVIREESLTLKRRCSYFSLLNLDNAESITIENAKYPLSNGSLPLDRQYGISNERLPNIDPIITVKRGSLLLVQSLD